MALLLVETATDNITRTVANVRSLFNKEAVHWVQVEAMVPVHAEMRFQIKA
jgi:transcriptional/translational regulatory protein YebC/TACO1